MYNETRGLVNSTVMCKKMKVNLILILSLIYFNNAYAHDSEESGLYVLGNEVHTFKPCNKPAYWVDVSGLVLEPLKEYYQQNTNKPYQSIYIKVKGHVHNELYGLATDYAGIFYISKIYTYTNEIPNNCK